MESFGGPLVLQGVPWRSKVDLLVIWGVILEGRGHHFLKQMVFWTAIFRYIVLKRFLESVWMVFWSFEESPEPEQP